MTSAVRASSLVMCWIAHQAALAVSPSSSSSSSSVPQRPLRGFSPVSLLRAFQTSPASSQTLVIRAQWPASGCRRYASAVFASRWASTSRTMAMSRSNVSAMAGLLALVRGAVNARNRALARGASAGGMLSVAAVRIQKRAGTDRLQLAHRHPGPLGADVQQHPCYVGGIELAACHPPGLSKTDYLAYGVVGVRQPGAEVCCL